MAEAEGWDIQYAEMAEDAQRTDRSPSIAAAPQRVRALEVRLPRVHSCGACPRYRYLANIGTGSLSLFFAMFSISLRYFRIRNRKYAHLTMTYLKQTFAPY
jgi:hypothetical protein